MKIEQTIKEIQEYFIDKILKKDFEFNSRNFSLNTIVLTIDEYYKFEFHFDFQEKRAYQLGGHFRDNFFELETTKEQEEKIYKIFQFEIECFLEKEKIRAIEEIKRLAEKYNLNLNNL